MSEIKYISMQTIIRQAEHIGSLKALIEILMCDFEEGMGVPLPVYTLLLKNNIYDKFNE